MTHFEHPNFSAPPPYWFGVELEGAHIGKRTIIVADYTLPPSALPRERFDHVFLATDYFCFASNTADYDLATVCAAADSFAKVLGCPVTLPVLPDEYERALQVIQHPAVSLAVRVWVGTHLRQGDSVVVRGPAFYVTSFEPSHGVHVTPDDYAKDEQ